MLNAYQKGLECEECNEPTQEVGGEVIYPHRQDLWKRKFRMCPRCKAYVGTHVRTGDALGSVAGPHLRKLRSRAHLEFDVLWQKGNWSRTYAYRWLADRMCISDEECHIGMMDELQCAFVIGISISQKIKGAMNAEEANR